MQTDSWRKTAAAVEADWQKELQRPPAISEQTLNIIQQKEQQAAQYEQADRNYTSQRASLEQRIEYRENDINLSRGRG